MLALTYLESQYKKFFLRKKVIGETKTKELFFFIKNKIECVFKQKKLKAFNNFTVKK
jgi:hypothetical protein